MSIAAQCYGTRVGCQLSRAELLDVEGGDSEGGQNRAFRCIGAATGARLLERVYELAAVFFPPYVLKTMSQSGELTP